MKFAIGEIVLVKMTANCDRHIELSRYKGEEVMVCDINPEWDLVDEHYAVCAVDGRVFIAGHAALQKLPPYDGLVAGRWENCVWKPKGVTT